jgi:DNA-binding PucR family transcriptional regulator
MSEAYHGRSLYSVLKNQLSKKEMERYVEEVLGPIKEYDRYNDTNMEEVLKTYLDCNGSVQEAAKKMYVHRNTINYKIKKIESLTHKDVSSLKVREDFDIAFMIQEIVNESE